MCVHNIVVLHVCLSCLFLSFCVFPVSFLRPNFLSSENVWKIRQKFMYKFTKFKSALAKHTRNFLSTVFNQKSEEKLFHGSRDGNKSWAFTRSQRRSCSYKALKSSFMNQHFLPSLLLAISPHNSHNFNLISPALVFLQFPCKRAW